MIWHARLFTARKKRLPIEPLSERAGVTSATDGLINLSLRSLIALNGVAEQLISTKPKKLSQRAGQYISSFKGRGMEFSEARPYIPGDDIRTIDWRVTARTGKTHTKLFREERERAIHIAVDLKHSMHFATRGVFKSVIASKLAALLAWQAQKRGDRLGGMAFSENEHLESRPQTGRMAVLHFFNQLVRHSAWSEQKSTDTDSNSYRHMLQRLQRVVHPGAHITIISDFIDINEEEEQIIGVLARHSDIRLIYVYDPFEQSLPHNESLALSQRDQVIHIDTRSETLQKQYHQQYQAHYQRLSDWCKRYRIQLIECTTEDDPYMVLHQAAIKRVAHG
jgi:uncharacterized protein (DUF58 family)